MAQPTNIYIQRIPSTSLSSYPRLATLVSLINRAFITSWRSIEGLVGEEATRYETDAQFVEDMTGGDGVTWVGIEDEGSGVDVTERSREGRMVATAGYKLWKKEWKVVERLKAKSEKDEAPAEQMEKEDSDPENAKYELVVVAVDPSLQKSGLATRLCNEVEVELKEKLRREGKKRLHLMIRTGKENNGAYWTRKGYHVVGEQKFSVGDFGSKTGFSVLEMERVIEL